MGDNFSKSDFDSKLTALTNNKYNLVKDLKVFKNNSFSLKFSKVDQNGDPVEGAKFMLIERDALIDLVMTFAKAGVQSVGNLDFNNVLEQLQAADWSNIDVGTILGLVLTIVNLSPDTIGEITIPAILTATSDANGIVEITNSSNMLNMLGALTNNGISGEQLAEVLSTVFGSMIPEQYLPLLETLAGLAGTINVHTGMVSDAYVMLESEAPKGYARSSLVYTFVINADGTATVSAGVLFPVIVDAVNSNFGLDLKEILVSNEEFEKYKDTIGNAFDTFEEYSTQVIDNVVDFLADMFGDNATVNVLKRIKNSIISYNDQYDNLAQAIGQTVKDINSMITDYVTEDWKYYNTRYYVDINVDVVGCNDSYIEQSTYTVTDDEANPISVNKETHSVHVPFGEYLLKDVVVPQDYELIEESVKNDVVVDDESVTYSFVSAYHKEGEPVTVIEEPTCVEDGAEITRVYCELSGELLSEESEPIEAKGHNFGEWEPVAASTCTGQGSEKRVCKDCGFTETKNLQENGHKWNTEFTVDKAATCSAEGSKSIHCANCEAIKDSQVIPRVPHTVVTDAAKAPTCTETGLSEGKHCSVCNEVLVAQNILEAKGHTRVLDEEVKPTCTDTGLSKGWHCSVCNEVLEEQKVIPAKGHVEVPDEAIPATCTASGLTAGSHCEVCNATIIARDVVPAKGHDVAVDFAVEATCTEPGLTMGTHCVVCNTVIVEQKEIPAKGHRFGAWEEVPTETRALDQLQMHECLICGFTETTELEDENHNWNVTVGEGGTEEFVYTIDKEPTCTTNGSKSVHCNSCAAIKLSETIPAKGHTEVKDEGYAPTCTEFGLTEGSHCADCGNNIIEQHVIPATGHNIVLDLAKPATCTDPGLTQGERCTVCGETLVAQAETPARGHKEKTVPATDATCVDPGLTEGTVCEVCGEVIKAQETVPAKGHSFGAWETVTSPDCTDKGSEKRVCEVCGFTETRDVDETGHDWEADFTIDKDPDCTNAGSKSIHCKNCDAVKDSTPVPATGHTEETVTGKPATCTEPGITDGIVCSVCGETIVAQEEISAAGHKEKTVAGKPATCTESGITDGVVCSVCGETIVAQEEISATGHKEKTVAGKPATCTEPGLTEGIICEVCGKILVEQVETATLGHSAATVQGRPATCTENGVTDGVVCSVCGETIVAQEEIPAKGHTEKTVTGKPATCTEPGISDGKVCSVCGETIVAQEEIPAKGHTEKTVAGKPATATEPGLTDGIVCAVCGAVLKAQETIPATGELDPDPAEEPEIIPEGTNALHVIGDEHTATIHCTGPLDKFKCVLIDGVLVDESNYTLSNGSTIITFASEFLDTLEPGEHDVTLVYTYASVETALTILEHSVEPEQPTNSSEEPEQTTQPDKENSNSAPTSPDTGIKISMPIFFAVALTGVITAVGVAKKKNEDEDED